MNKNTNCDSLDIAVNIEYLAATKETTEEDINKAIKTALENNVKMTRGLSMDYRASLRELMEKRNMNFTDIAYETLTEKELLISPDAVGNIINGKANPKPGSLILICCALRLPYNVSMDILMKANCMPSYYNWNSEKQEYDDAYALVDQIMQATAGQKAEVFFNYLKMFGIKIEKKALNFHF